MYSNCTVLNTIQHRQMKPKIFFLLLSTQSKEIIFADFKFKSDHSIWTEFERYSIRRTNVNDRKFQNSNSNLVIKQFESSLQKRSYYMFYYYVHSMKLRTINHLTFICQMVRVSVHRSRGCFTLQLFNVVFIERMLHVTSQLMKMNI